MRESVWDKLRKEVYAEAGNVCQVCGASGRLNCDEVWQYDDENHVQLLIALRALCNMCHFVKHIGRAEQIAAKGQLDLDAVIEHFMNVNGVDRAAFQEHLDQAAALFRERSAHDWQSDFGSWADLLKPTA